MKTLFLLRHCEANQFEENKSDHDKELNKKGIEEAMLLKQWFIENDIVVDHILASSATRTLKTASNIFSNSKSMIQEKKEFYLSSYKEIIGELRSLDNKLNKVIVVGHEPSVSECLKYLILSSRPDIEYVQNSLYPTGGLAIIFFSIKNWAELDEKTGILDAFITPKYIKENE